MYKYRTNQSDSQSGDAPGQHPLAKTAKSKKSLF